MYENPKLNRVGNAEDVILGVILDGADMDGFHIPVTGEFASDADPEMD